MISGIPPFRGESTVETLYAILKNEPPALEVRAGVVPEEVGAVVEHCLEKSPSARFQSVRDLAFTLDLVARSAQTHQRLRGRRRGGLAAVLPSVSASMFGFLASVVDMCRRSYR
jgi:serine/threonine protein kinase